MAGTALITHPICLKHDMGRGNPECPLRLEKIQEIMLATGTEHLVTQQTAPLADYSDLLAAHDEDYLRSLMHPISENEMHRVDVDTSMNAYTWEAAQFAAGACCSAVNQIMSGDIDRAFCCIRPPGHHAKRSKSGGFCFLNNAAIGALRALNVFGLKRVAIVDFDVHHADGTVDILWGRDDVLILDAFQQGLYPYAHLHHKPKNVVYSPFEIGTTGQAFTEMIDEVWIPRLLDFGCELIFVSAGFDAHRDEEQAQLLMGESDYAFIARRLIGTYKAISGCKGVVCTLEGGYSTSSLARSCTAFIRQLSQA